MKKSSNLKMGMLMLLGLISVSCVSAQPQQWREEDGGNGHFYEVFLADVKCVFNDPSTGITWIKANEEAQTKSFNGLKGHLATIRSEAENNFIKSITPAPSPYTCVFWLGGSKPVNTPAGTQGDVGWEWVTGEKWSYVNWISPYEPNNMYGGERGVVYMGAPEDALSYNNKDWNDYPKEVPGDGYIVEYEAITGVPEFPSVVIPVAAILSLVVIFGRKKNTV